MAVNRAVSSHVGRVVCPEPAFWTRRSCGRADGAAAPGWRSVPATSPRGSPPGGRNERYEPGSFGAVAMLAVQGCRPQPGRAVQKPSGWAVPNVAPAPLLRRNVDQTLLVTPTPAGRGTRGVAPQRGGGHHSDPTMRYPAFSESGLSREVRGGQATRLSAPAGDGAVVPHPAGAPRH